MSHDPHPFDEEDSPPEWFQNMQSKAVDFKPWDRVVIQVNAECDVHGQMEGVGGRVFYSMVNDRQGTVQPNLPDDHTKRPWKSGHTVRVQLLSPVGPFRYKDRGPETAMFGGGLFLPQELRLVGPADREEPKKSDPGLSIHNKLQAFWTGRKEHDDRQDADADAG